MYALIAFIDLLLDGRPMEFVEYRVTDRVTGRPVNAYRDTRGRFWLAEHRWASFRVRKGPD